MKFQAQRDDVTVATMSFDLRAGNETDFLLVQDFTKREAERNKNPSAELSFSEDFFFHFYDSPIISLLSLSVDLKTHSLLRQVQSKAFKTVGSLRVLPSSSL